MSLNHVVKSFKHFLNPTETILTKLILIELFYLDLALTVGSNTNCGYPTQTRSETHRFVWRPGPWPDTNQPSASTNIWVNGQSLIQYTCPHPIIIEYR